MRLSDYFAKISFSILLTLFFKKNVISCDYNIMYIIIKVDLMKIK